MSLPHLHAPSTSSYSEPDQSSPCLPSYYFKIHFIIVLKGKGREERRERTSSKKATDLLRQPYYPLNDPEDSLQQDGRFLMVDGPN